MLAPTGTIGFLMDCDTTGIEPDIALVKYKLLAGGGMLKIVNQTVARALEKPRLRRDREITEIIAHIDKYDTIEECRRRPARPSAAVSSRSTCRSSIARSSRTNGTRSLHYRGHIRMMAAAQPFLSGAISKTVNLPEDATVEDIMQHLHRGWRLGLKAIAIYRDGSKRRAPLNIKKTKDMGGGGHGGAAVVAKQLEARIVELEKNRRAAPQVSQPERRRMPDTRISLTHKFDIAGHEGYITVGLFDDAQPRRTVHHRWPRKAAPSAA